MSDVYPGNGNHGASTPPTTGTSDAVLIVGGGIAGMHAALHLAVAGRQVILVERGPTIGGRLASVLGARMQDFDPSMDERHQLVELGRHSNIEILTLAEVTHLSGDPGRFMATIRQKARFVTDQCVRCGECRRVCPVAVPNEHDAGLSFRKAIHTPFHEAVPQSWLIDIDHCLNDPPNYLPCRHCVSVCEAHCIQFDMPLERTLNREVRSVIVATGYNLVDPLTLPEYGYGAHPDVMTALELEHMLGPQGPAGGDVVRPSNEDTPERVLFILGVGSRKRHGVLHSSGFSWRYTARQVAALVAQGVPSVSVLYQDQRAYVRGFFDYWTRTVGEDPRLIRGHLESVLPGPDGDLLVSYEVSNEAQVLSEAFDLVVLVPEVLPAASLPGLAGVLGFELANDGFVRVEETLGTLVATSRPGIYVAGCASGPKDIADSTAEGRAAAIAVLDRASRRTASAMKLPTLAEPTPEPAAPAAATPGNGHAATPELQEALRNVIEALLARGGHG